MTRTLNRLARKWACALAGSIVTILLLAAPNSRAQFVFSWVPPASNVNVWFTYEQGEFYADVHVLLPTTCHYLEGWGGVTRNGTNFVGEAGFYQEAGSCGPRNLALPNRYTLGQLSPGNYRFTFRASGQIVTNVTFYAPAPGADTDHDGMIDWSEYLADTDRLDPTSNLYLTRIERVQGGRRITWRGGVNAWQILERSTSLAPGTIWTSLTTNNPPTLRTNNFVDLSTNPAAFYRLKLGPRQPRF